LVEWAEGASVEVGSAMPKLDASPAREAHPAAEIAGNGKNLPQTSLSEDSFAHKFAALVDVAAGKVEQQAPLSDPSAAVRPPAVGGADVVMALRQPGPLPAMPVAPRVGSAEWGSAVGEKMMWMANQSHQVAELHLNPPNLGPLEVRLTINNDQASALFVSHHSAVRDAIETALPRLREMLADNGITLGNTSVGSESFSQQQQAFEQRGGGKEGGRGAGVMDDIVGRVVSNAVSAGMSRDGMVDIFA
jgi:flagellar hook-length control protein FliK